MPVDGELVVSFTLGCFVL